MSGLVVAELRQELIAGRASGGYFAGGDTGAHRSDCSSSRWSGRRSLRSCCRDDGPLRLLATSPGSPVAFQAEARTASLLDPVANIFDAPSGHADEQFDRGGEGARQNVTPQRRLRDRDQGEHLRQTHEAGEWNDRCCDINGVAQGNRGSRHPDILAVATPPNPHEVWSPDPRTRPYATNSGSSTALPSPAWQSIRN